MDSNDVPSNGISSKAMARKMFKKTEKKVRWTKKTIDAFKKYNGEHDELKKGINVLKKEVKEKKSDLSKNFLAETKDVSELKKQIKAYENYQKKLDKKIANMEATIDSHFNHTKQMFNKLNDNIQQPTLKNEIISDKTENTVSAQTSTVNDFFISKKRRHKSSDQMITSIFEVNALKPIKPKKQKKSHLVQNEKRT